MTFAEIFVLIAVGYLLYRLMNPLRRRLESRMNRFFRSKTHRKERPIIDITDYSKKDKHKS